MGGAAGQSDSPRLRRRRLGRVAYLERAPVVTLAVATLVPQQFWTCLMAEFAQRHLLAPSVPHHCAARVSLHPFQALVGSTWPPGHIYRTLNRHPGAVRSWLSGKK